MSNKKWFARACFWAAAYCFVVVVALAIMAQLHWLPGHDLHQFWPFLALLGLIGAGLCGAAMLPEREFGTAFWAGLELGYVLVLLTFMSLFLAADALAHLTASNAPALLLIPPGLTFFVAAVFSSVSFRGDKKKDAPQPETKTRTEPGPVSARSAVWRAAAATVSYASYMIVSSALVFGEMYVAVVWGFGVRAVLGGAHFDALRSAAAWLHFIAQPPILIVLAAFAAFLVLGSLAATTVPMWTSVFTHIRLSSATDAQKELVQTRFRALVDYANVQRRVVASSLATNIALWLALFLVIAAAFWVGLNNDALAVWLYPPHLHGAGWYLDERKSNGATVPLVFASFLVAASVVRLVNDLWPSLFEGVLIFPLRRGTADAGHVRSLFRALLRDVRKGTSSPDTFDARGYLRARRLRRSYALYAVTGLALVLAGLVGWRGFATYTLIDNQGFEDIQFFTGEHIFYRYQDAMKVLLMCDWKENNMSYDILFRDQEFSILLNWESYRKKTPALVRVDENLRRAGVKFGPVVSAQPKQLSGPECVRALGRQNGVEADAVRIMHAD